VLDSYKLKCKGRRFFNGN